MNITELDELSEQELDTLAKRISAIKSKRRQAKITSLIKNFKNAWYELENEGAEICYRDCAGDLFALKLDDITFDC